MNKPVALFPAHRDVRFDADNERLAGTLITEDVHDNKGRILFLHGAGNATRQRSFYLADSLATRGYDSFCFDFSGHGESTGTMRESSLARRVIQAQAAIKFMGDPAPDILIGSSMGAYIAASLASSTALRMLILMCPALYADEAYRIPLDQEFTSILRRPSSYRDASVLKSLASFSGKVLLLIGEEDKVIPGEVMNMYRASFPRAALCRSAVIPNAPHKLHVWGAERPENREKIIKIIDDFLLE